MLSTVTLLMLRFLATFWLVSIVQASRPDRTSRATSVGDSAQPSSLVQTSQTGDGWPGLSPYGVFSSGTVLLSQQLSESLETVAMHTRKLTEQVDATSNQIELVKDQLSEDELMLSMLDAQIAKVKDGRKNMMSVIQASLSEAHKTGHETLKEGLDTSGFLEKRSVETPGSFLQLDDFFDKRAQRLQKAGINDTSKLEPQEVEGSSFAELSAGTADTQQVQAAGGPEDDEDDVIFNPLKAKSIQMERSLDQLQDQRLKVQGSMTQTQLTIKKLEEDMKIWEVMKDATHKQVSKLKDGRKSALLREMGAFQEASVAGESVIKTQGKHKKKKEHHSHHKKHHDEVLPQFTTSTTQAER
mmetsp:Transcript_54656/g.130427  ORF Transcript_54656/g.130427 Transcript_54656/m.130427 type:complete len:356 (-) Transcript_54656:85-1152(-)|eukprot:CAMPEP_0178404142 /NCGR_PEP_ID=MMETSP0689_2-20121128/17728_1 /TAXON_ID=160604 /ORGANISM="Amphidinium massartii, Strain CS-259" /LENGTH=355 /DNA_ID=CAMNT_0020025111 /DNA_START=152 /DNA_END=1219 /DNA_ORIENTATION=+